MVTWTLVYTKQANKDAKKLAAARLKQQAKLVLNIFAENAYHTPPPYEKVVGYLACDYSRQMSIQHRMVCQILPETRTIKILLMWTYYE